MSPILNERERREEGNRDNREAGINKREVEGEARKMKGKQNLLCRESRAESQEKRRKQEKGRAGRLS